MDPIFFPLNLTISLISFECLNKICDRTAAELAATTLCSKMSANSIRASLPALFAANEVGQPWQSRALSLKIITSYADFAPMQLGASLPDVVPEITKSMSETKREVREAALQAMTASCDVVGNRDIEHLTSKIVRSITNQEEVPEIMHSLAGVTFVQSVQSPALAMVVPLLLRGLRSSKTSTRRQGAVISTYFCNTCSIFFSHSPQHHFSSQL